ncbi:hypothetical protein C0993_009781 [Termitomyces sp. T159_Od127]|nr:hypothetical protein C0993_009781 [Termitomyces sp. T159_Od127]
MALSFLSQLSTFGCPSHAHASSGTKHDFSEIPTARNRAKAKIELQLADRSKKDAFGCFKYPRKCANGGFRPMAQMLRVLDLAHEAIIDDTPATKRDIYYKDVSLFKNQRTVDSVSSVLIVGRFHVLKYL